MKKALVLIFSLGLIAVAHAAEVSLVYESEAAVLGGKFSLGTVTPAGILTSAQLALSAGNHLLVAPLGDRLYHAKLLRLDNQLEAALVQLGDVVDDAALQAAGGKQAAAVAAFAQPAASLPAPSAIAAAILSTGPAGPFAIKIDGAAVGAGPVVLRKGVFDKARFTVAVVRTSTAPVWNISLSLSSDPSLGFWKQGRSRDLTDVPAKEFHFDKQILFKPMGAGDSFDVGVEAYYIKQTSYLWTFTVKTKSETFQKKVPVEFK